MKRSVLSVCFAVLAAATFLGDRASAGTGAVIYRANPQVFEDSGIAAPGSQVPVKLSLATRAGVLVNEAFVLSAPSVATGPDAGFLLVARGGELRSCADATCSTGGSFASSIRAANGGFVQARLAGPTTVGGVNRMTVESGSYTGTFEASATSDAGLDPVADVVNAEPGSLQVSTASTMKGFASTTLSVTGGEYRLNGGAWTTASSSAKAGDRAEIRVAAGAFGTSKTATVAVAGGSSVSFTASTRVQDTTPDAFALPSVAGAEPSTSTTSATVVPTGYEGSVPVSVTGGTVSVAGGVFATSASIVPGQSLAVRVVSAASFGAVASAQVTVGGGFAVAFSVTTRAQDTLPDAFSVPSVSDATVATTVVSAPVTPTGYEGSVAVAAADAEVSTDGGTTWAASGSLVSGASFKLRTTAAAVAGTAKVATVTVGTSAAVSWTVTTAAGTAVPPFYVTAGGAGADVAQSVRIASDGAAVVSGSTTGADQDIMTARFSPAGSLVWATRIGGSGTSESGVGAAIGPDGSIYEVGNVSPGPFGGGDGVVTKRSSSGTLVWQKAIGTSQYDSPQRMTVDAQGNVYVAGLTYGYGISAMDAFLTKMDANGNVLWTQGHGYYANDLFSDVAVASDGSVYVSGQGVRPSATDFDGFLVKYSSAGALQWQRRLGSTSGDYFNAVAVAPDGSVVVSGSTQTNVQDGVVAKFTAAGALTWKRVIGGAANDTFLGVTVDASGAVYAGGVTAASGNNDALLVKLASADGSTTWQRTFGGTGADAVNGVAVTSDGALFFAGSTNGEGAGGNDAWYGAIKTDGSGTGTVGAMTYGAGSLTSAAWTAASDSAGSATTTSGGFSASATSYTTGTPSLTVTKRP